MAHRVAARFASTTPERLQADIAWPDIQRWRLPAHQAARFPRAEALPRCTHIARLNLVRAGRCRRIPPTLSPVARLSEHAQLPWRGYLGASAAPPNGICFRRNRCFSAAPALTGK